MIPFNTPPVTGNEKKYVLQALDSSKISGDGLFGKACQKWFEKSLPCQMALVTPSCTAALELAALLIDIQPGDEVIMPSYTFVSTANAFVLRGAKIVFVDIRPDTMNINEWLIEPAITDKTRAIVPVHYAGIGCEMDVIMDIASRYNLYVIEDAAQGMMSTYKGKSLGTIGHLGTFSFHETKNYTSGGEGGLLIINDESFQERAEILREKGTNRSKFFRGQVDKYSWVDIGSSYLMSELQAAYLYGQLKSAKKINNSRLFSWNLYLKNLQPIADKGVLEIPSQAKFYQHNGHIFYIKTADLKERDALISFLKNNGIMAVFHYIPLHTSLAGKNFGHFNGIDFYTTRESKRILRLPLWLNIKPRAIELITNKVAEFYSY